MTDDRAGTERRGVAAFDFYSHATMHLPFNEGYLRILRSAYPDEPIRLFAAAPHLQNLRPRLSGLEIDCQPITRFKLPFGLSFHNPLGTWLAANACLAEMRRHLPAAPARVALLGVDAGLYRRIRQSWRRRDGDVDMLMHGSLAANYVWRSRNPLIRAGDFRTVLKRRLPAGVRLVGLELGVDAAIAAEFPALAPSLAVLEHPVLASEWSEPAAGGDPRLAIGFLGYGSKRKGFDVFVRLADEVANPAVAFDAVGHANAVDGLRTTSLRRQLAETNLDRDAYLDGLRALDLVCLPLDGRSYEFAASGTVSDAIAALKPVIAFRNRTLQAIEDRYGPIGRLFETADEMAGYLRTLDRAGFEPDRQAWVANLRRVREARLPEVLGRTYRI